MAERRFPVVGDVDLANSQELQGKLLVLVNATDDDLVLDCAEMGHIDSMGISVFVHTQQLLDINGRGFRLENLSPRCRRVFDMLGLSESMGLEPEPA
jgi:anti-anti-sigma factor